MSETLDKLNDLMDNEIIGVESFDVQGLIKDSRSKDFIINLNKPIYILVIKSGDGNDYKALKYENGNFSNIGSSGSCNISYSVSDNVLTITNPYPGTYIAIVVY